MYKKLFFMLFACSSILQAQEQCSMLIPEVKTMGISRLQVDLDDIEIVTLPIVFHVAHTGPTSETNISDEQILSQLEILNEEFEDSKIQFCLAVRDPEGNPTNGITIPMRQGFATSLATSLPENNLSSMS